MKLHRVIFFLFAIPILSLSFVSCSDDDERPDMATQISGTYDYRGKLYVLNGSQLDYLGSDLDVIGTAIVSKTSTGFEMKEGGEVVFKGAKLAQANNGITFDIETQTVDVDGQAILVEGYDGFVLSGVRYNGAYETTPKRLTGYFQFIAVITDENGNSTEETIVVEIIGSKV